MICVHCEGGWCSAHDYGSDDCGCFEEMCHVIVPLVWFPRRFEKVDLFRSNLFRWTIPRTSFPKSQITNCTRNHTQKRVARSHISVMIWCIASGWQELKSNAVRVEFYCYIIKAQMDLFTQVTFWNLNNKWPAAFTGDPKNTPTSNPSSRGWENVLLFMWLFET